MRYILIMLMLFGCAHKKPQDEENLVSVETALKQAQFSYLRGCVDALKELGVPVAFPGCKDKAILHHRELEGIMNSPLNEVTGDQQ